MWSISDNVSTALWYEMTTALLMNRTKSSGCSLAARPVNRALRRQ